MSSPIMSSDIGYEEIIHTAIVCAGRLHEALDGFPNLRKDLSFAILSFAQRVFKTDRLRAARSCV